MSEAMGAAREAAGGMGADGAMPGAMGADGAMPGAMGADGAAGAMPGAGWRNAWCIWVLIKHLEQWELMELLEQCLELEDELEQMGG